MRLIEVLVAPMVFNMAISFVFSITSITSELAVLKVATIIISVRVIEHGHFFQFKI